MKYKPPHFGDPLTDREIEILVAVAEGHPYRMTSERLGIRYQTLKNHLRAIHLKLGVQTTTATFRRIGWLQPTPEHVNRIFRSTDDRHDD